MTAKEKYNAITDYFKRMGDTEALKRAENKPNEYYEKNRVYDILEELESK